MLTHGSLFTGVGGIDLGFDAAGIETLWQCEINAQCRSVLAKHWPNATRYEDVSAVKGDEVKPVDIITFGSPCQDLSIAGKRAGFQDGTRSNLYFEAIRIIEEMRNATGNQYPRIAVWENVRGALSSRDGADFEAAIQALADIGAVDISWRVVNTCHFGPPQRRVRVFVVADFGGECAGEVLAQSTRVLWNPPKSREEGKDATGDSGESVKRGSKKLTCRDVVGCLSGGAHPGGLNGQDAYTGQLVIESYAASSYGHYVEGVGTLRAGGGDISGGSETIVIVSKLSNDVVVKTTVRRLTPKECERLQGWPDDHTRYTDTGKELSDSARYKMCGNGVSAPVAQWIGENIAKALKND